MGTREGEKNKTYNKKTPKLITKKTKTYNSLPKAYVNNTMFMAHWIILLLQGSFLRLINMLQNSSPRSAVTNLQMHLISRKSNDSQ